MQAALLLLGVLAVVALLAAATAYQGHPPTMTAESNTPVHATAAARSK